MGWPLASRCLLGAWRVLLRTGSRGLTAMIDSIRADGVASYRRFATSQDPELCGGDDQH
jgi:hypothetical protein